VKRREEGEGKGREEIFGWRGGRALYYIKSETTKTRKNKKEKKEKNVSVCRSVLVLLGHSAGRKKNNI